MEEPLAALWARHQESPFPQGALPDPALVQLDVKVGAILTGCLRTDGVPRPLPDERRNDLARGREAILRVLAEAKLDGEARAYFERLEQLAAAALRG